MFPHEKNLRSAIHRDYVYFQDFIPENDCDIRVVIVGERAFGIKRMVREGDFRASGSGVIVYGREEIPLDCVAIAFDVTRSLRTQSCAFDFVRAEGSWRIVEISYAFSTQAYRSCPGYWDRALSWHPTPVAPERFMMEDVLAALSVEPATHYRN